LALQTLLVGAGRRGQEWLTHLRAHPGFAISGIVDPDPVARRAAGKQFAIPESRLFATIGDPWERVGCDAVVVASPFENHYEATEVALEKRLPNLVEKPLCPSLLDANALVESAGKAGVPLMVAMNHRYQRAHRAAKEVIGSGKIGRVGTVNSSYYRTPHDMSPSLSSAGNRVMWGMAIHHLDALRYVLGSEIVGVFARSYNVEWETPPEGATLTMILDFDNGAKATYSATYSSRGHEFFEGGQEFYQRLIGEKATLHMFHRWLFVCERARPPIPIRRGKRIQTEEMSLLDDFASAIKSGSEPSCSGRDHLRTLAVAEGALLSAESDRWVNPAQLLEGNGR
jgi:predicted dehydrogenase